MVGTQSGKIDHLFITSVSPLTLDLYYTGIITIVQSDWVGVRFKMSNYVIEQQYYQYFHQVIRERTHRIA